MNEASEDEKDATGCMKLPYEPPRVEETAEFERLVLACSRQDFTACEAMGDTRS